MEKEFIVHTDASNEAVEAILSQKDENQNEYVIAYASKLFRSYEKHMSISEKEMAGIVFGIKEFRPYIFSSKHKIRVVTDHKALHYLISLKDPTRKLARCTIGQTCTKGRCHERKRERKRKGYLVETSRSIRRRSTHALSSIQETQRQ